jgi:hypothetical protein
MDYKLYVYEKNNLKLFTILLLLGVFKKLITLFMKSILINFWI